MTISIIGLGNMGLAIAQTAIRRHLDVVVWNRTSSRYQNLEGSVEAATDIVEAITLSDTVILVLPDYETTAALLNEQRVATALSGKTFIQLCSGTPEEARAFAKTIGKLGGHYLDGKIFTYPSRVGAAMTRFVYAGSEDVYRGCADILKHFGDRSSWLGEDPGFAAAADLAWLSFLYGSMTGLFQGLAYTRTEGLADDAVFDSVPSWLVEIQAEASYSQTLIKKADFHGNQAALDVHVAAMQHLHDTAKTNAISGHFPETLVKIYSDAVQRGFGDQEITAALDAFCHPKRA